MCRVLKGFFFFFKLYLPSLARAHFVVRNSSNSGMMRRKYGNGNQPFDGIMRCGVLANLRIIFRLNFFRAKERGNEACLYS